MSEQSPKKDTLDALRKDPNPVALIMELYDLNEEMARRLWERFLETVEKMKTISESVRSDGKEKR